MYANYDYYRIFYYVARYGGVSQAAKVLSADQPNLTRAVKNLESALGCPLFARSRRGMTLTPEGEKLYAHVRIAFEHIEAGEAELLESRNLQSGTVFVAASEVALRGLLLPVLKKYRTRYPGVRVRISNHSTPQAVSALKNGLVDIAMVTTPTGELNSLTSKEICEVSEIPVCGTAFSQLAGKKLSLSELSTYPLISLGKQTKTYESYSEWFRKNNCDFTPDIEAATADQILPMVKNNLGIGFVPEEFLEEYPNQGIISLELQETVPSRQVCYLRKKGHTMSVACREMEKMILSVSE